WSRQRAYDLARANAALAYSPRSAFAAYPQAGWHSGWWYSPLFGAFTFFPIRSYRSYWGYNFAPVAVLAYPVASAAAPGRASITARRNPVRGPVSATSSSSSSGPISHASGGVS